MSQTKIKKKVQEFEDFFAPKQIGIHYLGHEEIP